MITNDTRLVSQFIFIIINIITMTIMMIYIQDEDGIPIMFIMNHSRTVYFAYNECAVIVIVIVINMVFEYIYYF